MYKKFYVYIYTEKIFTKENANLNFVQLKLNNTKQQQQQMIYS